MTTTTASSQRYAVCYANASAKSGAGHIMRLYAIAQALARRDFIVKFLYKECTSELKQKLLNAGFVVEQLHQDDFTQSSLLFDANLDVLLIDDYHVTAKQWHSLKYRSRLTNQYALVVLDDDLEDFEIPADIVINGSAGAHSDKYRLRSANATLCLGNSFAILRDEFKKITPSHIQDRTHLLITMGGTDVKNMSLLLATSIINVLPEVPIYLVIGKINNERQQELNKLSQVFNNLIIKYNVNNIAELMNNSRLAISAAGSTLTELACIGVPTVALVSADNQASALQSNSQSWYQAIDIRIDQRQNSNHPCESYLPEIIEKTTKLWHNSCILNSMSQSARQLIDAKGCDRIANTIVETIALNIGT